MSRIILCSLVLVAMAGAQVFGVVRGYWCECAEVPMVVGEVACGISVCGGAEADGCGSEEGPCGHPEPHKEIRDTLMTTMAVMVLLPSPQVFDLCPSLMEPDIAARAAGGVIPDESRRVCEPCHGSPPAPLLVARTVVMLV